MEEESIYGVNLNGDISPFDIRDAIIECYYQADKEVLNVLFSTENFSSLEDKEKTKRHHIEVMIKKFFDDVNGDFNNPTKESLIDVINKCREFASKFREKEVIEKNYNEIMTLISRLDNRVNKLKLVIN